MKRALGLALAVMLLALPTAAAQPTDHEIDEAMRFRSDFGLRADRVFVEDTLANVDLDRATWGVPLTKAELVEMSERARIGESAEPLMEYGRSRPGVFGGAYIDQPAGGVVNVLVTDDADAPQWTQLAPTGATVKVRTVARTEKELDTIHDRIMEDWRVIERHGVSLQYISTEIPDNVVEVGVKGLTPAAKETLKADYGPGVRVVEDETFGPAACPDSNCANPLKAGLKIDIPAGGGSCTSGFHTRGYGGNIKMLTAGHCNEGLAIPSAQYEHPGFGDIGRFVETSITNTPYELKADAGLINIWDSQGSRKFFVSVAQGLRNVTAVQNKTQEIVGQVVCKSGFVGGYGCGYLETTSATYNAYGHLFYKQRRASTSNAKGGDSGGPVFYGTTAKGVVSAYGKSSGKVLYTHIKEAKNALGWDHLCGIAGDNC
jgi:hypothetical protein